MSDPGEINAEPAGMSSRLRAYRILVVDDEEDIRDYITAVLQDAGAEVMEACDGNEAVEQARKHKPDLITLDLSMPGKDGVEAFNELRRTTELSQTPICIITGHPEFRSVIYNRPLTPPEGYLNKPVTAEEVVETISRILGLREKRAARSNQKPP
ncbi:MAG: response regulator [Planctomycetota bacterium]